MLKEECFQSGAVMWPLQFQYLYQYYNLFLRTVFVERRLFSIGGGIVTILPHKSRFPEKHFI